MSAILSVTFPFFALVLCGYVAVRRHLLPQLAIPGLNGFVLYFALPCLLYRFGATTPIAQLLDRAAFGLYLVCAVLTAGLTLWLTLRRGDWNNAAFGALLATFPNTGFMGVPLLVALLGAHAAGPVIMSIAIDMVITTSICLALSRLGQGQGQGRGSAQRASAAALRQALAGMLRNPMPWSIALGMLASAAQWALPAPVEQTVALLAGAASPVALFTIGAVLARSQMNASSPTPLADYLPVALAKLLLHPLLMLALGHVAIGLGLALDPFAFKVLVLLACLPSASNVALLAERYGADSGRVARIILASTALSFFSFSAAVALLA